MKRMLRNWLRKWLEEEDRTEMYNCGAFIVNSSFSMDNPHSFSDDVEWQEYIISVRVRIVDEIANSLLKGDFIFFETNKVVGKIGDEMKGTLIAHKHNQHD